MEYEHRIVLSRCRVPALAAAVLFVAGALHAAPILEHSAVLTMPRDQVRPGLPVSVTAGAGEVCVTDAIGGHGHVYDERNSLVFSTGPLAGLSDPLDLTVEGGGGFVCTDAQVQGGRTIRRLNLFGEPVAYLPQSPRVGWRPEHLLVTRDGDYVTTDPSGNLLAKHRASDGTLLWSVPLRTDGSGELISVGKPAEAPDGSLYVPLGGDRTVLVLTAEGQPQTSFGVPGTGRGRFTFPVGVAFCPDGSIAVLDRMRATVLLFDPDHKFLAEFGEYGTAPQDLYQPVSIAATPDGRVFVAQGFLSRVQVFRFFTTGSACIPAGDQACPTEADGSDGPSVPGWQGGG